MNFSLLKSKEKARGFRRNNACIAHYKHKLCELIRNTDLPHWYLKHTVKQTYEQKLRVSCLQIFGTPGLSKQKIEEHIFFIIQTDKQNKYVQKTKQAADDQSKICRKGAYRFRINDYRGLIFFRMLLLFNLDISCPGINATPYMFLCPS